MYPGASPSRCNGAGNTGGGKISSAFDTCDSSKILNSIPDEMWSSLASCAYTQLATQDICSCTTCDDETASSGGAGAAGDAAGGAAGASDPLTATAIDTSSTASSDYSDYTARRLQQHTHHEAGPFVCSAADTSGCQEPQVGGMLRASWRGRMLAAITHLTLTTIVIQCCWTGMKHQYVQGHVADRYLLSQGSADGEIWAGTTAAYLPRMLT
jgi:hypothetical protein